MKLNNQEKMIYKSILYRKIEHLNLKDDIKEKFIDNVLDEAENKFRKSFSLFLRELFNKRLTELLNNKVPALTKKEYKLILTLKQLDLGLITIDEVDYNNRKEYKTILNYVLNNLIKNEDKMKEAIIIYPGIKKYAISKKLSISIDDLKIIENFEKENSLFNGPIKDKTKLKYKVDYLTTKIDKELFKELYPNTYRLLYLTTLGLTIKETEILNTLDDEKTSTEKARELGYKNRISYTNALRRLYLKINQDEKLKECFIKKKIKIININLFRRKLTVRKAPTITSFSKKLTKKI